MLLNLRWRTWHIKCLSLPQFHIMVCQVRCLKCSQWCKFSHKCIWWTPCSPWILWLLPMRWQLCKTKSLSWPNRCTWNFSRLMSCSTNKYRESSSHSSTTLQTWHKEAHHSLNQKFTQRIKMKKGSKSKWTSSSKLPPRESSLLSVRQVTLPREMHKMSTTKLIQELRNRWKTILTKSRGPNLVEFRDRRGLQSKPKIRIQARNKKTGKDLRKSHHQWKAKDWTAISSSSNLPLTTSKSMIRWATRDPLAPKFRLKLRNKHQRLFPLSKRTRDLPLRLKRMLSLQSRRVLPDHRSRLPALVQDPCLIPAPDLHQRALLLLNPKSSRCLPVGSKSQTELESQDPTPSFLDIQWEKPAQVLVSIRPNFSSRRVVLLRSKGNTKKSLAFWRLFRVIMRLKLKSNKVKMSKRRQRSQLRTSWCYLGPNFRLNRVRMELLIQFQTASTPMKALTTHSWKTKSAKRRLKSSNICKPKKKSPTTSW